MKDIVLAILDNQLEIASDMILDPPRTWGNDWKLAIENLNVLKEMFKGDGAHSWETRVAALEWFTHNSSIGLQNVQDQISATLRGGMYDSLDENPDDETANAD